MVADLSTIIRPDEEIPRVGIRSCHRVPPDREEEFVRHMLDSGMGILVPEALLPRHPHTGALLKGGFFGVPHTRGRQRLIFDRRAFNECEDDLSPSWLWLPHVQAFGRLAS